MAEPQSSLSSSSDKGIEGIARHGNLGSPGGGIKGLMKWLAVGLAVVLAGSVGVVATAALNVGTKIQVFEEDGSANPIPDIEAWDGPINMLLVGTDTREGQEGDYTAADKSSDLADVIILLRISADHSNAVAISFPRDLMTPIPACPKNDGSGESYSAMSMQQINSTIQYGGVSCTVKTLEEMTGIEIPFYALINFNGVIEMSNAIGGVEVCVTDDIDESHSGLKLTAGEHTLKGEQALAFLRNRKAVGDGSDLGRISAQQVYMSSMVRKLTSEGTLSDPVKLYGLANAAAENIMFSQTLADVNTLYSIAKSASGLSAEKVTFLQIPVKSGAPLYPSRVVLKSPAADDIFERLQNDEEFVLDPDADTGRGSEVVEEATTASPSPEESVTTSPSESATASPSASPEATDYLESDVEGQTAATVTCAKTRTN